MSQQNESGIKCFTATAAISRFRRVKLSSGSGSAVEHAGADSDFIGVAQHDADIGEPVAVALRGAGRTFKCVAAGAVTVGAVIYGAATGKVDDAVSGTAIGSALEAAAANGDEIECWLSNGAAGDLGDTSVLNFADGAVGIPLRLRKVVTACGDTTVLAAANRKMRIADWWFVCTNNTAGNWTLKNGNGDTIGAAVAHGTTDQAIVSGGKIDDTYDDLACGCALVVTTSGAAAGILYVDLLPEA